MTIQTTNIDAADHDAVDLISGDEAFYTIANGVVLESQEGNGISTDTSQAFFIYNNGSIVADFYGVELGYRDHFYNERAGSVFGVDGVLMASTGESFVNYGDVSGFTIGVSDMSGGNEILNYGTIEGPQSLAVAGGDTITNAGTLEGAIAFTGAGTGTVSSLTNSGTITGALTSPVKTDIDNSGLWNAQTGLVLSHNGDVLTNAHSGKIDGNVKVATGGDTVTNAGSIDGSFAFTGSSTGRSTLTNTGSITGNVNMVVADNLVNHGQIHGNVVAGNSDVLTNTGTIHGAVTLGVADTFNFSTGKVAGPVTGAAGGKDIFEFTGDFGNETIGKFVDGTGTTHDTIQFASNDFSTFAQVHAASTQQGSDVVIRLDAADSITLTGATLASLTATDFKFV